jgi:ubiquinone/menaquinone biosynthesis C-methylase UbiE
MTFADAKQRFSNRVTDYLRYRPGYPTAVRDVLRAECNLQPGHVVADIGSGTGFLSELFLKNGNRVFGVEPNAEMRRAGEDYLAAYDAFASIEGTAEATTLDDAGVDFVTAGQAFHWFEPAATRREFVRILKPSGWATLIWNERLLDTTPFLREYEALLLKFGTDYSLVAESYPKLEKMREFFGAVEMRSQSVPNHQDFDFDGLRGRLQSASYAPTEGHPNFQPMMDALKQLFDANQQNGQVRMEYLTRIYFGQLSAPRTEE